MRKRRYRYVVELIKGPQTLENDRGKWNQGGNGKKGKAKNRKSTETGETRDEKKEKEIRVNSKQGGGDRNSVAKMGAIKRERIPKRNVTPGDLQKKNEAEEKK